jgi:protein-L-isoaspartate(D-aspartate) O-methyltransferase
VESDEWPQYLITFADRQAAEDAGTSVLRPGLPAAGVTGWWFVRKTPAWRLRIPPQVTTSTVTAVETILDSLTVAGQATDWRRGIYEPETIAFGGPAAITVAHMLAHHDSLNALDYLSTGTPLADLRADFGRREIGVILATALLRSAGLDWYEQGDVWAKVAQHRPADNPPPMSHRHLTAIYRLLTADTTQLATVDGPLAAAADWMDAFRAAGRDLTELNATGTLQRGLRAVLAHHILFAWNRLGLTLTDQHTLSRLATSAVMHGTNDAEHPTTTTLTEVNAP